MAKAGTPPIPFASGGFLEKACHSPEAFEGCLKRGVFRIYVAKARGLMMVLCLVSILGVPGPRHVKILVLPSDSSHML